MSWMLRRADSVTDRLAEEVDLDEALRALFRMVLGCPESDFMYDSYPIDEPTLVLINEKFGLGLDPTQGPWFLEYDSEPRPAPERPETPGPEPARDPMFGP